MATGRIFKITKEQAGSYELLKAPRMRKPRRARANPGVTAIMGISNPARRVMRNPDFPFIPKPGMVLGGRWVIKKVSRSLKRITIYMPQDKDYGYKVGKPLTFSWDEKMGTWKRQGQPIPSPGVKANRGVKRTVKRPATKLRAVKKTQMVGGIQCLAKPSAKRKRQGLTKRSNYALPQCFRYPVQKKTGKPDPKLIRRALSYYGRYKSRYSKAVRDQIERGIAKAAKSAGLESPKAMQYRRKFGLANPGEDSMIVMRKNAARKTSRKKSYGRFSEFVLFPARGKGAKGVSGRAGKSYKRKGKAKRNPPVSFTRSDGTKVRFVSRPVAAKKKPAKRATKKSASKKTTKRIVLGPEPKNKKTKAWRSWNGRRLAASRWGTTTKKPTRKARKAPARKARTRRASARKRVTSTVIGGRIGALKARRVSRSGSRRFGYMEITGAKRVSVKRGVTSKKRGKTLKVAVKNYDGKPATWYRNKTKAVANLMRNCARRNPDAREEYWAEQAKKTAKPKTRGEMMGTASRAETREMRKSKDWTHLVKDDTAAAAAAAATGVAPDAFATEADFEKWLKHQLKTSRKFRGVYSQWLRKKRSVRKAGAAKKGKKMAARKTSKKRTARRKPRTTKAQCKKLRPRTRKHYSCISRLRKKPKKARKNARRRKTTGRRTAARRPITRRRTAARRPITRRRTAARRPAKKRRVTRRRRARRNMGMKARANQMFAQLTALAKPTGLIIGGFLAHRLLTGIAKGFLAGMMSDKVASIVTNLAVLGLGRFASMKALPANSTLLSLGMATNAGLSLIADLFPDVKTKLGLGIPSENMRARYVLSGFGQPIMQAAAGFGQPLMQAAAGTGEYFNPMGEYVSNDLYPSGGDFGEYVASNLDIQGYGDYEIQDTYGLNSGGGYFDDGVRPDGDLGREFAMMEAKAGVGQPIMQAAAGLPSGNTYLPSQQAGLVRHSETSYDAGIFDIGGGNGVLS